MDHLIAIKHGGSNSSENLACACVWCNRYKGTDFGTIDPATGKVVLLFNPRQQAWKNHFGLDGALIVGLSEIGLATVALLQMNHPERVIERQMLMDEGSYPPDWLEQKAD